MQQIRSALSLFNGISGLHLSLDKAQINVEQVYYSEIDKFANKVTEQQYPNDIALGDVTKWKEWDIDWSSVDLVSAGFPCQAWSVAGKQLGDKDERGMLFWTTLDIIKTVLEHNPKAKFLMENVKMKKDFEEYITHHTTEALGYVEKTLINSALVSAQNRNRYYWTNFEVTQPEDKGILLKNILEQDSNPIYKELESDIRSGKVKTEQFLNGESQTMRRALANGKNPDQKANTLTSCAYKGMGTNGMTNVVVRATVQANAEHTYNGKSPTLTASMGVGGGNVPLITDFETSSKYKGKYIDKHERLEYRKLTPLECERLQTVPDNWTECLSNTQRYKSLGNGWTIDVIVHILECAYK
jgi:DNA (cytosine-5)-methyltransferase 1/DNA (cytosine-5)-methyltransferase 3A